MATDESNNPSSGRRVSFLMPYIDFCFMLIIIFVGMLSIAYFEPLGRTDIQTVSENRLDTMEGEFEKKPAGIQSSNFGVGEKTPTASIHPLTSATTGSFREITSPVTRIPNAAPQPVPRPGATLTPPSQPAVSIPATATDTAPDPPAPAAPSVPQPAAAAESHTPSENNGKQPGAGNSYYIDLRSR